MKEKQDKASQFRRRRMWCSLRQKNANGSNTYRSPSKEAVVGSCLANIHKCCFDCEVKPDPVKES